MKKRFLALLLVLALALTVVQSFALADDIQDLTADKDKFAEAVQSANHSIGPNGTINDPSTPYTMILPGETIGIISDFGYQDLHTYGNINYSVHQLDNATGDYDWLVRSAQPNPNLTPLVRGSNNLNYRFFGPITEIKDGSPETYTYIGLYRNDTGLIILMGNGGIGSNISLSQSGEATLETGGKVFSSLTVYNQPNLHFLETSYKIDADPFNLDYGDGVTPDMYYWPNGEPVFPTSYTVGRETKTYTFPVPVIKGKIIERWSFSPGPMTVDWHTPAIGESLWEDSDKVSMIRTEEGYVFTVNTEKVFTDNIRLARDQTAYLSVHGGHTVAFNGNGGTIGGKSYVMKEAELPNDNTFILDIGTVTAEWEGHNFLGWCTDKDNPRETLITDTDPAKSSNWRGNTDISMHTELYAVWDPDGSQPTEPNPPILGRSGWRQGENGGWSYLDENGTAVTGWQQIAGTWYYFNADGSMATGWLSDGGAWYYFDASGVMASGWQNIGGSWYYFKPSGAMATGWLSDGGTWYYFNADGSMATGWLQSGGAWYYFGSSGAMTTGWVSDGSAWYYFEPSGAMATGWQLSGGSWYYFKSSGAMATGWTSVGSSWYYFKSSGKMATGWFEDKEAEAQLPAGQQRALWYWFDNNGQMATGWKEIDGQWEMFDNSGLWLYTWDGQ